MAILAASRSPVNPRPYRCPEAPPLDLVLLDSHTLAGWNCDIQQVPLQTTYLDAELVSDCCHLRASCAALSECVGGGGGCISQGSGLGSTRLGGETVTKFFDGVLQAPNSASRGSHSSLHPAALFVEFMSVPQVRDSELGLRLQHLLRGFRQGSRLSPLPERRFLRTSTLYNRRHRPLVRDVAEHSAGDGDQVRPMASHLGPFRRVSAIAWATNHFLAW